MELYGGQLMAFSGFERDAGERPKKACHRCRLMLATGRRLMFRTLV
jgi:hypothetical protein